MSHRLNHNLIGSLHCWVCTGALILSGIVLSTDIMAQRPTSTLTPTIWLIGDSTVKNGADSGAGKLWGWGHYLSEHIDPARFRVENRALGGRSSRTYRTEGLWDKVLAGVQPGDLVLIQFGHNDGGPLEGPRARASLKGVGTETQEAHPLDKPVEVVHTYGWYLRQYVSEARMKGAKPILLSPIPRNIWTPDGRISRKEPDYATWTADVARAEQVLFVDLNGRITDRYEVAGQETVGQMYFTVADHTHTTETGAKLNAECVAAGLRGLPDPAVATSVLEPGNRHN